MRRNELWLRACEPSSFRALAASLLIVGLTAAVAAQKRDGIYAKTPWSINANHTLIWGGQFYVPVGIRVDGSPAAVQAAKQSGVDDVMVNLPASGMGWPDTLKELDAQKMRYLIRIDSLAPTAMGFAVEPQAYRVGGIDKKTHIEVNLPGAVSAFVVLASKRDGSVQNKDRVPVVGGKLSYNAEPGPALEHILLIYPEMKSIEQPDLWEGLDAHRDMLLSTLRRATTGAGLRGIVNPLGITAELPGSDLRFVPTSRYFRMELKAVLEQRYKNVETATRGWGMGSNDVDSLDKLARLVPLWSGERGVAFLLDPVTNKLYTVERRTSNVWSDIGEVIGAASARRFDRLVRAIRSVCDVPVVQEWEGWSSVYESAMPAVDGIGARVTGITSNSVIESACRATSSVLRWKTNGWLLSTDVDLGPGDVGGDVPLVIDDLSALGSRGFFLRGDNPKVLVQIKQEAARKATDTGLSTASPTAIFYPENATNPANPQRIGGGKWWLPTPQDGNRLDFGPRFFGYRLVDEIAIWTTTPGRYKLRMVSPKVATFRAIDGTNPAPKLLRDGVEVLIGQFPLLIRGVTDIPTPDAAYVETAARFDFLMKMADSDHRDIFQERMAFKQGMDGFDRNPGGNFLLMRDTLNRLAYKVGRYTWIEAERSTDTNFSESEPFPGASAAHVLSLRTPIPPGAEGYYAQYEIPTKTKEEQEVWIAAKVPAERRASVTVSIGGQPMRLPESPTVLYGQGLGWYKLGSVKLAGPTGTIRISVDSAGQEVCFDAIVLTPRPFHPSGVTPPDPVEFPVSKR